MAEKDSKYVEERAEVDQGRSVRGKEVRQGVIIDQIDRVVVPKDAILRAKIILEAHEPPFYGHFGAKRMYEVVARNFW